MKKPYTVFITGASEGIGASIARTLCSNGLNVFAFARREAKLHDLKTSCSNMSGNLDFFAGDVTSNDDLQKASNLCLSRFSNLDINAYIFSINFRLGVAIPHKRLLQFS